MPKRNLFILLICTLLVLMAGCGGSTSSSGNKNQTASLAPSSDNQVSEQSGKQVEEVIELTFTEPSRILSLAPFYVAIEQGYFAEEGIEANISSGGGGAQVIATLLSGQAQFAVSGPRSMLSGIEAGEEMLAVQSLNSALTFEVAVSNEFMQKKNITPDAPFAERVAALNGATIGTNVVGDSGDVYLRYLLKLHDQDYSSLQMVKLTGNGPKIGGMQEGVVDGGIASPPFALQAKEQGIGERLLKASEEPMYANMVWEVVFAKKDYIENNPDIVKKVIKAIGKGIEFTRENPKEAAESITSYFEGVSVDIIEQSLIDMQETFQGYGEMNEESWDNSQIPLLEFGELSGVNQRHDPTEGIFWTNKYIEEVFGK